VTHVFGYIKKIVSKILIVSNILTNNNDSYSKHCHRIKVYFLQ